MGLFPTKLPENLKTLLRRSNQEILQGPMQHVDFAPLTTTGTMATDDIHRQKHIVAICSVKAESDKSRK